MKTAIEIIREEVDYNRTYASIKSAMKEYAAEAIRDFIQLEFLDDILRGYGEMTVETFIEELK